jgi:catechol 2,3-dioxygenase-like lactoylglutathione lyase family enzyme
MTSRIAVLVIDARHPERIAEFWCQVLGWVVHERDPDGVVTIAPAGARPGTGDPAIDVAPVPGPKSVKNRLHLDLRADGTTLDVRAGGTARDAEVERLLALGARRADVGQGRDVSWVVLADPEGNEFCLLQRSLQEAVAG